MELFESSSPWVQSLGTLLIGLVVASLVAAAVNLLARKLLGDPEEAGKVASVVFWTVSVVAFAVALGQLVSGDAADLGLTAAITRLLGGLPNLLIGLLIAVLGWLLAVTVRATLERVVAARRGPVRRVGPETAFWAILVLAGLIAADQVGIAVGFLQALLLAILGAALLALALAGGLGGRDAVGHVVAGRHIRRIVQLGDEVEVAGRRGTIIGFRPASVRMASADGELEVPNARFLDDTVVIVNRAGEVGP